jgi:hypothetical protein
MALSDEAYREWKRRLLFAENPSQYIENRLRELDNIPNRDDILACFADTMKEVAEGNDAKTQTKFREAADTLYQSSDLKTYEIGNDYYVGMWNKNFRSNPEGTIQDLQSQQDLGFKSSVLESFSKILDEEGLEDIDGTIRGQLEALLREEQRQSEQQEQEVVQHDAEQDQYQEQEVEQVNVESSMAWDKGNAEYKRWSQELRSADDPKDLIDSYLHDEGIPNRANILACFADTMKDIGENGTPEEYGKFNEVATRLYQDDPNSAIVRAFYVGGWRFSFNEDPSSAIEAFKTTNFTDLELKREVLESFNEIAEEEGLGGDIESRLVALSGPDLQQQGPSQGLGDGQKFDDEQQQEDEQQQRQSVGVDEEIAEDEMSIGSTSAMEQQRRAQQQGGQAAGNSVLHNGMDSGDPITTAIRERVLKAQREVITGALVDQGANQAELQTPEQFRVFCLDQNNAGRLEAVFKDEGVKRRLEEVTLGGQQSVLQQFSDPAQDPHFSPIEWNSGEIGPIAANVVSRSQIVRDEGGNKLYTLKEDTTTFNPPKTVKDSQGQDVLVSKSRIIDMPGDGDLGDDVTLHLSLVLKDKNGNAPSKKNAVYFTAHYEHGKLVEMSTPTPVKFGPAPDQLGYIEHNGNIYTIPVTKDKYDSMMRTIAQNKGQSQAVNLSVDQNGNMLDGRDAEQAGPPKAKPPALPPKADRTAPPLPPKKPGHDETDEPSVPPLSPSDFTPPPERPSVSTSMGKSEEIAALNAALGDGNISELLDRLQVNKGENTVTLKGKDGEADIVLKLQVVKEYLAQPEHRQAAQKGGVRLTGRLNNKIEEMAPFNVEGVDLPSAAAKAAKMVAGFSVKVSSAGAGPKAPPVPSFPPPKGTHNNEPPH